MTDNQTTELLCKLLEERGIEFDVFDVLTKKAITWSGNVCHWIAITDDLGLAVAVYKDYLTPEQTIAATLGNERIIELEQIKIELQSLVKDMMRDCIGCKFDCYSENNIKGGYCKIFERACNLTKE